MKAALVGIAAAIGIAVIAGVVLVYLNPTTADRYSVRPNVRIDRTVTTPDRGW